MRKYDYLVIGQGLSGTCLTLSLEELGKSVLIIDHYRSNSSSRVAAGFIHPITGRRIVKTWMAEVLLPFAFSFYKELEKKGGSIFLHEADSLELIREVRQLNDWQNRSAEPGFSDFFSVQPVEGYEDKLVDHLTLLRLRQSGWLNIPKFLEYCKTGWKSANHFIETESPISNSEQLTALLKNHDIQAEKIIFCEGELGRHSELWNWLPFNPAKGELLEVDIPDLPEKDILFNGIFFIPLGNGKFRVGSTYSWNPLDEIPTAAAQQALIDKIKKTIRIPFTIIGHRAGVRPAVDDRRPFLGRHPQYEDYFIFNGLGSKGSILAPWFGKHLAEHLVNKVPLMKEVDISRFPFKP